MNSIEELEALTPSGPKKRKTLAERFWEKVVKTETCWLWTASSNARGYGSMVDNGKQRRATHISWELHTGEKWPQGMYACHKCDNPPCVNPEHLFAGTQRDNIWDAKAKGRIKAPNSYPGYRTANEQKTHCKRGHEFTPENTYLYRGRNCKTCCEIHRQNYANKKRLQSLQFKKGE